MRPTAEQMQKALELVPLAETVRDVMRLCDLAEQSVAEFNFPANIIMHVTNAKGPMDAETAEYIRQEAEKAMLQLALHNIGLEPASPVIIALYGVGWRAGGDHGIEKVK